MISKARGRVKSLVAFGIAGLLLVAFMAPAVANNGNGQSNGGVGTQGATGECQETGVDGLTAHYVNEVPHYSLDVECDIGIFFDQNGRINNVEIRGTEGNETSQQFGVYVHGANVDLTNSSVSVEADYRDQFVSVSYRAGSSGNVRGNVLEGAHRVGLLIRGADTSVQARGNTITGSGAKTSNWAENGIQIDQQAHAVVANNEVHDHYWANNDWVSSGIVVFDTSRVNVQRNTITGGDMGLWLEGENHTAIHNTIETSSGEDTNVWNDGVYIDGANIGLRHNNIRALREDNGDVGVWVLGSNNKLIGNFIEDFADPILDFAEGTKLPSPFDPGS